jgi:tetratricopeptide (TPR) repeat protein
MRAKVLTSWVAAMLICAHGATAQSPVGDAPRLDGLDEAVRTVASALRGRTEIAALKLTAIQLDAYVAATLQMDLDHDAAARRVRGLAKDEDASRAVVSSWTRMQQLQRQITANPGGRKDEISATLSATYLAARASAALARTEPSTIGGHAPAAEGRRRAKALLDSAVALAPGSTEVQSALGDLFVDAEEPEEAETAYRKALMADGTSIVLRTKLAEALRLQGKFDEAVTELRAVLKTDAGHAQAYSDLGMILRAQGKPTEAISAYREAIRLAPDSVDSHNGLAITFAENGKVDEAIGEFREMVRIDPDSAIGYYNLATALAAADRDVEAAAALREVVRINPNHYNARYNLGELFRLEGKYEESAGQFREYLRLAPETPQNRRNIQRARQFVQQFSNQ